MSSSRHRMPRESARVSRMLGRCVAALVSTFAGFLVANFADENHVRVMTQN